MCELIKAAEAGAAVAAAAAAAEVLESPGNPSEILRQKRLVASERHTLGHLKSHFAFFITGR